MTDRTFLAVRFARNAAVVIGLTAYSACSGSDLVAPLPPPTLSEVTPAVGVQGTTMSVSVAGKNFVQGGSGIVVTGTGISVASLSVAGSELLAGNIVIAPDATLGAHTIAVKTAGGTSSSLTFTVNPPPPTLTSLSAVSGVAGTTVNETLNGANFVAGATVAVSGTGVSISNVVLVSPTAMTADFALSTGATLGDHTVTVSTAGGTSGAKTFTVLPPAPTFSGLSVTTGVIGTTVSETLTGTSFVAGATVAVSGTGVTVANVALVSATSITADFVIAAGATLGAHSVTVTTSGGTSTAQSFTVNPPAPTLTGLRALTGVTGTTVSETLTGTNFVAGATVVVSGTGVTVSNTSVVNASSITADFILAANATLGGHSVTVTTTGGTSGSTTFIVNPPSPTATSLSATAGVTGTTVSETITGTNFVAGATVVVSGTGVTVANTSVVSATSITADFAIASGAALGDRTVTVTTSGGTSGTATFTVLPPAPTLSTLSATTGVTGTTVNETLTGTNFVTGATVSVGGTGVTVANVSIVSATSITADFVIATGATLGGHSVTVSTSGGISAAATFTVNPPAPTLTALSATTVVTGTTVNETLTGTNFVAGATVAVSGSGVTVANVSIVSATSITADFVIAAGATLGGHSLIVSTSGGVSAAVTLTVLPPAPTLTGISPAVGVTGTAPSVTLTGTNFVSGATIAVSGTGVTVANIAVVSATSITADFTIASGATLGARTVSVTTSGGTSGTQSFTVNPSAPTLTGLSPSTGAQSGSQTITLTGTNFQAGATTVSVSGSAVTVSSVNVTSGTSLTATFTVDVAAATGARNVTVTTAGGTSGAQTFTVVTGPAITSFASLSTHVTAAQVIQFNWTTTNAATCSIDNGIGSVGCNTSTQVTPGTTRTYTLSATSAGATATASQQIFANEPGRFVYAAARTDNQLRMYSFNASTGGLTAIGGGTVGLGAGSSAPVSVAVDPAGKYAYAVNNGSTNVSMYLIDATTGALTSNGTIAASGTNTQSITVDPTGRFAYVVNAGPFPGNGSVNAYSINGSGQLVSLGAAIAAGTQPIDITIDPLGRFAYIANTTTNNLSLYSINANGTLTSIGTQSQIGAGNVAAHPNGQFLYATTRAQGTPAKVIPYTINSNGTLTAGTAVDGSGTMGPVAVDPTGRFVFALDINNSFIWAYSINQTTGGLTAVNAPATGSLPNAIAVDPQGKFVYTTNGNNTISIFSIDQSTGAVTLSNTIATGNGIRGIVVSR